MTSIRPVDAPTCTDDLAEDLATAWIPDVLDGRDYSSVGKSGSRAPSADGSPMSVPRVGGGTRIVFVLSARAHVDLHSVVSPLASSIDEMLDPGVCGYRRGADPTYTYLDEYRRFSDWSRAGAEASSHTAFADVEHCFEHIYLRAVADYARDRFGAARSEPLRGWMEELQAFGMRALPAGYGDTRLLANLWLSQADGHLGDRFTRWVDDYRLFAFSREEVEGQVEQLAKGLAALGLSLNPAKTRIFAGSDAVRATADSLASVYHPDLDDPRETTTALRRTFAGAAAEPIRLRRHLRFVLPRLARQGDDFALKYALSSIDTIPWEAPRLVAYISTFAERAEVREIANRAFEHALRLGNDWLIARLVPLLCRTELNETSVPALAEYVSGDASGPVRGLGLRLLAAGGYRDAVAMLASRVPDQRAVLAACAVVGVTAPALAAEQEPGTAMYLSENPPPLPPSSSLL
jgi:hypothetical protein